MTLDFTHTRPAEQGSAKLKAFTFRNQVVSAIEIFQQSSLDAYFP